MKVLKFGGTSLSSPERLINVLHLAHENEQCVLVLSAISGTTNALEKIGLLAENKNVKGAKDELNKLENFYKRYNFGLNEHKGTYELTQNFLNDVFEKTNIALEKIYAESDRKTLLALGEQMSTTIAYFKAQELFSEAFVQIDALSFMSLNSFDEPDIYSISEKLSNLLVTHSNKILITQGYICSNAKGEIDNLRRGGSDYTASLIGEAIGASEIQIWTDIDGMHNNDPREVENTEPIRQMSYDEAAELAYFGAKILHPQCVFPAQRANIPLRLKYTMDACAEGTFITNNSNGHGVKAIAAKDKITAIKIKSSRMLMAYGFLTRVFEVFETHKTAIDMITTSEVAVSLTIDDDTFLTEICKELMVFADVEVDQDQCIICIVGDLIADSKGYAGQLFNGLSDIPIRMVSYGGSKNNVSILIGQEHKQEALNALHNTFFQNILI